MTQPNAQRLADAYNPDAVFISHGWAEDAATELRRLDAVEKELDKSQHAYCVLEGMYKEAMESLHLTIGENDQLREQNESVDKANAQLRAELEVVRRDPEFSAMVDNRLSVEVYDGLTMATHTTAGSFIQHHNSETPEQATRRAIRRAVAAAQAERAKGGV